MLTKDDLKAIGELMKAEGDLIRKDTREMVKMEGDLIRKDMATKKDLSANIGILGQILKIELGATKKEITDAMKLGFKETTKAIIELKERHGERIEKLEKRVDKIEKVHLS